MWLQKGKGKHQKVQLQKLAKKVQLMVFACNGIIHQHICPPQQRIHGKYYTTILKQLLVHIYRKLPKLVNIWMLHYDNTPPHKAYCITKFLGTSPYSTGFASCDFWLFPTPKKALRGWRLCPDQELLTTTQTFFNHLSKSQFRKTFRINGQHKYRNVLWVGVAILRKIGGKMKILVVIVNKIFQSLFLLKIVIRVGDLDFTWRAISCMPFTISWGYIWMRMEHKRKCGMWKWSECLAASTEQKRARGRPRRGMCSNVDV